MRIIAGTHRGRKLISVASTLDVKPISDRIKQSLFDILRPLVTGSIFLDMFAGTGAVGLEALSRGALKVVFADNRGICIKTIKRNIEKFGFEDRSRILKIDLTSKAISRLYDFCEDKGYDIIFAGPPYRTRENSKLELTAGILKAIDTYHLLSAGGTIAAQHHKKEVFEVAKNLRITRSEKYGDTIIDFLEYKSRKDKK